MSMSVGALLRSLVQAGLREGLSYNELYRTVREAGVSVRSTEFAREYRYGVALQTRFIDFRGGRADRWANVVPTSDHIIESPITWPDRFNARVLLYGLDTETNQRQNRWVNIGYSRLPTFGTIADTAMVLVKFGSSHPDFEPFSVSGMHVESSAEQGG